MSSKHKSSTIAVRTGIESDTQHHAVVPPIYLSTNYGFPSFGDVLSMITPVLVIQTAVF